MKNVGITLWLSALTAGWALGAAACASAPPETFYTLSSGVRAAAIPPPAFARSVVVERPALPESVDRPQLVTVVDANRVAILEQQRWAEPLRAGIPRVVAESLARILGTDQVSSREDVLQRPDCRVSLDVRKFDARRGAGVSVEALWTVACDGRPRQSGRSTAHEPVPDTAFESIVAAQGRALDAVSREIAHALLEIP